MHKIVIATLIAAGAALAADADNSTTTPIKHVVVIFQENNSFDHYFGTYPRALNPEGEPLFTPAAGTPEVNGLTPQLLAHNANSTPPFRLDRSMETTCDNDNHYADEQSAYDHGLLDKFAQITSATGAGCTPGLSMGYYDGNTVTALWNYAQHYAMSDNNFDTEFGTTVMGHLNLICSRFSQGDLFRDRPSAELLAASGADLSGKHDQRVDEIAGMEQHGDFDHL